MEKISGYIIITDYELGLILMGQEKYFKRLKARINNENASDYNPNFKFSRERLIEFKDAFESLLGDRAQKCINYIIKYEQLNPDLKDYSNQRY